MLVRSAKHKGLKRLLENDDPRGMSADQVNRVRKILMALITAKNLDAVQGLPGWKIHQLTGDRRGTWSIAASGNWRITFEIKEGDITNLDMEDYH